MATKQSRKTKARKERQAAERKIAALRRRCADAGICSTETAQRLSPEMLRARLSRIPAHALAHRRRLREQERMDAAVRRFLALDAEQN